MRYNVLAAAQGLASALSLLGTCSLELYHEWHYLPLGVLKCGPEAPREAVAPHARKGQLWLRDATVPHSQASGHVCNPSIDYTVSCRLAWVTE